jgi:hypothetical protein
MKLEQTIIEKNFFVKHRGRTWYVSYVNSDGQTLALLNRDNWEIFDDENEELQVYLFNNASKKEKEQVESNIALRDKLVSFCMNHFNDYLPEDLEDCWMCLL